MGALFIAPGAEWPSALYGGAFIYGVSGIIGFLFMVGIERNVLRIFTIFPLLIGPVALLFYSFSLANTLLQVLWQIVLPLTLAFLWWLFPGIDAQW